jgi:hypothetical protein
LILKLSYPLPGFLVVAIKSSSPSPVLFLTIADADTLLLLLGVATRAA